MGPARRKWYTASDDQAVSAPPGSCALTRNVSLVPLAPVKVWLRPVTPDTAANASVPVLLSST